MDETLSQLANHKQNVSSLIISGCHGGKTFSGAIGEFSEKDLPEVFSKNKTLSSEIKSVNFRDCYTVFSQIDRIVDLAQTGAKITAIYHSRRLNRNGTMSSFYHYTGTPQSRVLAATESSAQPPEATLYSDSSWGLPDSSLGSHFGIGERLRLSKRKVLFSRGPQSRSQRAFEWLE